jgi:hypothetical protein
MFANKASAEEKIKMPRVSCVFFTSWPAFGRQPIELIPYNPGSLVEVAHTDLSGLVRIIRNVRKDTPTPA